MGVEIRDLEDFANYGYLGTRTKLGRVPGQLFKNIDSPSNAVLLF